VGFKGFQFWLFLSIYKKGFIATRTVNNTLSYEFLIQEKNDKNKLTFETILNNIMLSRIV